MFRKICFIFCLVACSSFAQTKNCEEYKFGEFVYPDNPNKVSVRKDTIQESYNNGKLEMQWKITWINDCTYEMVCQKVFNPSIPIKIGDRIVTTIIETDAKCYKFTYVVYNEFYPNGFVSPEPGKMCRK